MLEVVTNMSFDCNAEIVLSLLCCIAILDPFKGLILAQKCVWPFNSRWPCKSFALASFIKNKVLIDFSPNITSFFTTGQCTSQWKLQPTPTPPPPPTRSNRTRSRPQLCRKHPLSPPLQALPFNQCNQPELLPPSNISRRQATKLPICPLPASGDVS